MYTAPYTLNINVKDIHKETLIIQIIKNLSCTGDKTTAEVMTPLTQGKDMAGEREETYYPLPTDIPVENTPLPAPVVHIVHTTYHIRNVSSYG